MLDETIRAQYIAQTGRPPTDEVFAVYLGRLDGFRLAEVQRAYREHAAAAERDPYRSRLVTPVELEQRCRSYRRRVRSRPTDILPDPDCSLREAELHAPRLLWCSAGLLTERTDDGYEVARGPCSCTAGRERARRGER